MAQPTRCSFNLESNNRSRSYYPKAFLLAAALLVAACAGRPPSGAVEPAITNRKLSDCEREAAQSSAGSKAQAFDACMRAKKQTPTR